MRKPYAPQRPKLNLTCPVCGVHFTRHASSTRHATPTCSLSCARTLTPNKKRQRKIVDCLWCASPFEVQIGSSAKFCGTECVRKSRATPLNPRWTGGDKRTWSMRKLCMDIIKHAGKCSLCDATEDLQSHHVLPRSTHPELAETETNILVVCPPCHAKQHPEIKGFFGVVRA